MFNIVLANDFNQWSLLPSVTLLFSPVCDECGTRHGYPPVIVRFALGSLTLFIGIGKAS